MSRDAAILGIALGNASEREAASMHAAFFAGLTNGSLHRSLRREPPWPRPPRHTMRSSNHAPTARLSSFPEAWALERRKYQCSSACTL